jgi:hypothetical protein
MLCSLEARVCSLLMMQVNAHARLGGTGCVIPAEALQLSNQPVHGAIRCVR